jgi:hypothetical protein
MCFNLIAELPGQNPSMQNMLHKNKITISRNGKLIYSKYNSNVSAGGGSGTEARFVLQWNENG